MDDLAEQFSMIKKEIQLYRHLGQNSGRGI
jgi:hypothetical protein